MKIKQLPKKQCNHKWRVGSKVGEFINKQIVGTKLNIWCEKCPKVIKANCYSDIKLQEMEKGKSYFKKQSKKYKDESKLTKLEIWTNRVGNFIIGFILILMAWNVLGRMLA